jgi:hypothetical protein
MTRNYTIEQMAETRWFFNFTDTNAKGEKITVELSKCSNPHCNNSLPNLWFKHGYVDRVLETYWSVETYVTDTEGACWGRYNPQTKLSKDGKRVVINFDWMFEATEENKENILNEVYRLFSSAIGKTATEEKYDKVREYAKKHNIKVVTEMPERWFKIEKMTDPVGSICISNMKLNLNTLKDKNRKEALLLI